MVPKLLLGLILRQLILCLLMKALLGCTLERMSIQRNLAYIGLGFILLVALQLVIGGLADFGIIDINQNFKKYF